nr:MAG TPA: hypothetical protein [Caudoviricetes sp.]
MTKRGHCPGGAAGLPHLRAAVAPGLTARCQVGLWPARY